MVSRLAPGRAAEIASAICTTIASIVVGSTSLWWAPIAFITLGSSPIFRARSIPTSAWFWSESVSAPFPISCKTAARFASSLFAPISPANIPAIIATSFACIRTFCP